MKTSCRLFVLIAQLYAGWSVLYQNIPCQLCVGISQMLPACSVLGCLQYRLRQKNNPLVLFIQAAHNIGNVNVPLFDGTLATLELHNCRDDSVHAC